MTAEDFDMGDNNYNYGVNYGNVGSGGVVNNQQIYNDRVNYGTINNVQWSQLDAEMNVLGRSLGNMPPQVLSAYGEMKVSVDTRDESRLKRVLRAIGRDALDFFRQLGLQLLPSLILPLLA